MIISNEEMVEYDASHESSIAEISEESDPADLEDTLHSDDYVGNHSFTSSLGIQCIGSMSKDSHPVQPRNIKFPLHMVGKQYRAFTSSLYDRYPWIEHSECEDSIYCYNCRHFSHNRKEPMFVNQ